MGWSHLIEESQTMTHLYNDHVLFVSAAMWVLLKSGEGGGLSGQLLYGGVMGLPNWPTCHFTCGNQHLEQKSFFQILL